jgi:hypothetical protein
MDLWMAMDELFLVMKGPQLKIKNGSSGRTGAATISCRTILTQSFRLLLASEFEKLSRTSQIRLAFALRKLESAIDRMTIESAFLILEKAVSLMSAWSIVFRRKTFLSMCCSALTRPGKFSMSLCMLWVCWLSLYSYCIFFICKFNQRYFTYYQNDVSGNLYFIHNQHGK